MGLALAALTAVAVYVNCRHRIKQLKVGSMVETMRRRLRRTLPGRNRRPQLDMVWDDDSHNVVAMVDVAVLQERYRQGQGTLPRATPAGDQASVTTETHSGLVVYGSKNSKGSQPDSRALPSRSNNSPRPAPRPAAPRSHHQNHHSKSSRAPSASTSSFSTDSSGPSPRAGRRPPKRPSRQHLLSDYGPAADEADDEGAFEGSAVPRPGMPGTPDSQDGNWSSSQPTVEYTQLATLPPPSNRSRHSPVASVDGSSGRAALPTNASGSKRAAAAVPAVPEVTYVSIDHQRTAALAQAAAAGRQAAAEAGPIYDLVRSADVEDSPPEPPPRRVSPARRPAPRPPSQSQLGPVPAAAQPATPAGPAPVKPPRHSGGARPLSMAGMDGPAPQPGPVAVPRSSPKLAPRPSAGQLITSPSSPTKPAPPPIRIVSRDRIDSVDFVPARQQHRISSSETLVDLLVPAQGKAGATDLRVAADASQVVAAVDAILTRSASQRLLRGSRPSLALKLGSTSEANESNEGVTDMTDLSQSTVF